MKRASLILAMLALGACSRSAAVANNQVEIPANAVGDAPGEGLAAPANAAAAERTRKAALPAPTDGMGWSSTASVARFGPSPSVTAFAISCDDGRLLFRRNDAGPRGATGTMSFTGNGRAASLPAEVVGDNLATLWQAAEKPSDRTAAVARVFDGPAVVEIALAGTTPLILRPSPLPIAVIGGCGAGTKRAAPPGPPLTH